MDYYWFESDTPSFLIRQMQHFRTDITGMERIEAPATAFDRPTEAMENALPLLYQSGYLTITDYDKETQMYTLGIPNKEVRVALDQINSKGYALPYETEGSQVVKVGVAFDRDTMTVGEWKVQ